MPKADPLIFHTIYDRTSSDSAGNITKVKRGQDLVYPSKFVGQANPQYKKQIAEGSGATTPANGSLWKDGSMTPIHVVMWEKTAPKRAYHDCLDSENLPSSSTVVAPAGVFTRLDNQARAKAYSKMRTGFNASTFMGELRETLAMIKSPAMGLRKSVDVYRRNAYTVRQRYRKLRDWRRAASDLWLEAQFGWKPMLSDLSNAAEAYKRTAEKRSGVNFSGTAQQSYRSSVTSTVNTATVCEVGTIRRTEGVLTVRYKGTVSYKPSSGNMAVNFGSTWPDFVPTAWELIPWSFLIDYFANVGAMADSWATAQVVNTGWTNRTEHEVYKLSCETLGTRSLSGAYIVKSYQPGSWSATFERFKRSVPDGKSVPLPDFQFDTDLSISQGLNIAALIAGRKYDISFKPKP
jgi:hypothetical protein